MAYITGEMREQVTMFPVTLDELIPEDHLCRVIEAFVNRLAKQALGNPESLQVVADASYSNGEQAAQCEVQGIEPHVPANRGVNHSGDGTLFDRSEFPYDEASDTMRCPAGKILPRQAVQKARRQVVKLGERVQVYYCSTLVREIDPAIQRSTMVERWIPLPQP